MTDDTTTTTLPDAIAQFLTHLVAAGKAETTITAYRADLRRFAETASVIAASAGDPFFLFFGSDGESGIAHNSPERQSDVPPGSPRPPEGFPSFENHRPGRLCFATMRAMTAPVIDSVLADATLRNGNDGQPLAPATLHRRRAAIKAFLSWADSAGLADNVSRAVRLPRVAPTVPEFLTEPEIRALLKALRTRTGANVQRDRLIIELFLGTGMRLAELAALNIDDISPDLKHLHVRAKGGVPQAKFIKSSLRGLLRAYLRQRAHAAPLDETALFLSSRSTRLSIRQIANLVDAWVREAGIAKTVTPHTLRHSFATLLYQRTNDLLMVQRALGHRNLATTTRYTHLVDADLADAIDAL